jgi:hypothetical protein
MIQTPFSDLKFPLFQDIVIDSNILYHIPGGFLFDSPGTR